MKLFVTQIATTDQGTNMTIVSEWTDNEQGAIMAFHAQARLLWGDASVKHAMVKILDENLIQWGAYMDTIEKPEPEPEPKPEPEEAES